MSEDQQFRDSSGLQSLVSVQRRFHTALSSRRRPAESAYDGRGPLDGLGGGAFKTWRKDNNERHFWPLAWLPEDNEFSRVRIHTFGYDSDWSNRKKSVLNLHDFGRYLLGEMETSPHLRKDNTAPIILVGHSMGGLVVKKAYILARQESRSLVDRMQCLFFLATPHRGSDSASLLNNLLKSTGLMNAQPYINDLTKNSPSLQIINDEFRNYSGDVKLWSFYETLETNLGIKSTLIVNRDSAILGYKDEEIRLSNADHRGICKFDSPSDPNYVSLRNALVLAVEELLVNASSTKREQNRIQMRNLEDYLNISDTPEGDLLNYQDFKVSGSCQWIEQRETFLDWRDDLNEPLQVYWLSSMPGAGKSVCAAHIVSRLQDAHRDCSYYFFKYSDKSKRSLSGLLQSLAYQMAILHPAIRQNLLLMQEDNVNFDNEDEGAIWRKLFVKEIFKSRLDRPQFWVIDALDECAHPDRFFPLILRMDTMFSLRIFITSRPSPEFDRHFGRFGKSLKSDTISSVDTESDMRLYLYSDMISLPVNDVKERDLLVNSLVNKSAGCFLWVRLVQKELESVYSEDVIMAVLEEIPVEMANLYQRSLRIMSKNTREKRLAQAILTWAVCATRPLSLIEIQTALKIDNGTLVRKVKQSIEGLCGQLLYVDRADHVQLVHSTVREFFLDRQLDSEFAVERELGHGRLANSCLRFIQEELKPLRHQSPQNVSRKFERPAFLDYACTDFSSHVLQSSSMSDDLLRLLSQFLRSTVLAWIEYIAAEKKNLYHLIGAAKNLKEYSKRFAKHASDLGRELRIVDGWSTDLIKIVAKFGANILNYPNSIHFLVPPFAPPESMIFQQFKDTPNNLKVVGLSNTKWEDCVASIPYRDTRTTSLSCGESLFAIGMTNGTIFVYSQTTCQEKVAFHHDGVVRCLTFDSACQHLASAGSKKICLWSLEGSIIWQVAQWTECISLAFGKDETALMATTKGNRSLWWNIDDGSLARELFYDGKSRALLQGTTCLLVPQAAVISPDRSLAALIYSGRPIHIWSLDDETLLQLCGRSVSSTHLPDMPVQTALFNPNPDCSMIAVSYQDGELVLFDPWTGKELRSVEGNADTLAASPNGRTLATSDYHGTLQIWDFESLTLLYRIDSGCDSIGRLAFSGDGLRIVGTRWSMAKVWEPSVLIREGPEEDPAEDVGVNDAVLLPPATTEGQHEEVIDITGMIMSPRTNDIFVGKGDGSVSFYESESGNQISSPLYAHPNGLFVHAMASDFQKTIATVDAGNRLLAWNMQRDGDGWVTDHKIIDRHIDGRVEQLFMNGNGDRLLITTSAADTLWDITGADHAARIIVSSPRSDSGPRKWVCGSARERDMALLLVNDELQFFDWATFAKHEHTIKLAPSSKIHHHSLQPSEELNIKTLILEEESGRYLITYWSRDFGGKLDPQLALWDILLPIRSRSGMEQENPPSSSPPSSSPPSSPPPSLPLNPIFGLPSSDIQTVLGLSNRRLVFLDRKLWICSIDLTEIESSSSEENRRREENVVVRRHFFVPFDHYHPIMDGWGFAAVNSSGHVAFAKEGKIVVVKGGLNWRY